MVGFAVLLSALVAVQTPAPQPFPRSGTQQPPSTPSAPPPAPPTLPGAPPAPAPAQNSAAPGVPSEGQLGVQVYPGSQFLASYDAGRGQRYFLFGTTASFTDVVAFYRNVLRQKGDLIFDAPATHQFDIGRFREETMAFPPSVTIKEFQSQISQGFPNPRPNAQPERFPTVIQIVPAIAP